MWERPVPPTPTTHCPPLCVKVCAGPWPGAAPPTSSCREQGVSPYESHAQEASTEGSRSQSEARGSLPLENTLLAARCWQKDH